MYHFYDVVINDTTGVPLSGVIIRLYSNNVIVPLFADAAGTVPIQSVSGVANGAVTDGAGNFDFYVADGTYDMRYFIGDAVLKILPSIQMVVAASSADVAGKANATAIGVAGTASDLGVFTTPLVDDNTTAKAALESVGTNLQSNATNKGAALVGHDATKAFPENSLGRYFTRQLMLTGGPFNAPTDGSSDATAAIAAWRAQAGTGTTLLAPGGDFRFNTQQTFAPADFLCIKGSETRFLYTGASTTSNGIIFGDAATPTHLDIEGFTVDRLGADMTDGYMLVFRNLRQGWSIRNVNPGANANTPKIRNGVLFDNCNQGEYIGYKFRPIAKGIVMYGSASSDSGSDITLAGDITGGTDQVHIAGGMGGVNMLRCLHYGGTRNVLVDESIVARANRELTFGRACYFDAADIAGMEINVTSNNLIVDLAAFFSGAGFFSASPGDNILIRSMPLGRMTINSGHIKSGKRDGIRVMDATTEIRIGTGVFVTDNLGYGVNSTVPTQNVIMRGIAEYNTTGQIAANVSAFKTETPTISSSGTGWAYSGTNRFQMDGGLFKLIGSTATCTTYGSPSGAVTVFLNRVIKTDCEGMGFNTATGDVCYVRGEAGNNYITIQKDGGAFPFTGSGQTIRYAMDIEILQ